MNHAYPVIAHEMRGMHMSWFNTRARREELRELREVADRLRRMVNRIYPGAGNTRSPITAVATMEVWLTDTLHEKSRRG